MHENSLCEKSFWDILPSPERTILCEKIGFLQGEDNEKTTIGNVTNCIDYIHYNMISFFRSQL